MQAHWKLGLIVATLLFLVAAGLAAEVQLTEDLLWKGRIIVELAPGLSEMRVDVSSGLALTGNADLDAAAVRWQVYGIQKALPWTKAPVNPAIRDVSRFYLIEFPPEIDLHQVVRDYSNLPEVLSAEPYQVHKPFFVPNDTLFSIQWPLTHIHAPTAWDFTLGSSSVIIGIVDMGTDTAHPDLRENLWVNPGEDLNHNGIVDPFERNGIDDDGNGYIDDFYGWSFMNDNHGVQEPPLGQSSGHGTYCTGIATAATNNIAGISSVGCKAKSMTARVGSSGMIYYGFAGISYCAENGANIISLSWGGSISSPFEQAVINNAWDQGVIITASAGGNSAQIPSYPAAYDHVVAVGATDQNDHRMSFSNYGSWVDCYTPPGNISTAPGGGYLQMNGTSFSNPMFASLAALVWARQPTLTNAQVVDHILSTCAIVDSLNPGQTGMRRLDAGAALQGLFLHTSLTPLNPPIVIPASGGSFNYDVAVSNSDTVSRTAQFWCKVQLPSGAWYGPIVGPTGMNLPPGSSVQRTRTQVVPGNAPAGNYRFVAFLGEYPGSICSRDTILFTKSGTRGGDDGLMTDGGDDGLGKWRVFGFGDPAGPTEPALLGARPNPFNPVTAISYKLQAASQVKLTVYDRTGRLVATLVDGTEESGQHSVTFDGSKMASGLYFVRMQAGDYCSVQKLVLLK